MWIVQEETKEQNNNKKQVKAYIAFIGHPNLMPHVHVNADRGKGDFLQMVLDEAGSLDDIVESVLMGFGPTKYYEQQQKKKKILPLNSNHPFGIVGLEMRSANN